MVTEGNALSELDTLLTNDWTNGNTNSRTPTIQHVTDSRKYNLRDGDYVLLYMGAITQTADALNYQSVNVNEMVSVDIRTKFSRAHALLMRNEVNRIIWSNRKTLTNYNHMTPENSTDLSNKMINLWRWVIDVRFIKHNKDVSS
jgi:hypothetical protein